MYQDLREWGRGECFYTVLILSCSVTLKEVRLLLRYQNISCEQ